MSTCLSSPSVNRFVVVMIGNLPTNSGISPYLTKIRRLRPGHDFVERLIRSMVVVRLLSEVVVQFTSPERGLKPIDARCTLRDDLLQAVKRTATNEQNMRRVDGQCISIPGFFRAPSFGTVTVVPSQILSNACWTPSPETSRVMDTFSPPFLDTLSISSIYTIPRFLLSRRLNPLLCRVCRVWIRHHLPT